MSHIKGETRVKLASHVALETQQSHASHNSHETHRYFASRMKDETHFRLASQTLIETQILNASQLVDEVGIHRMDDFRICWRHHREECIFSGCPHRIAHLECAECGGHFCGQIGISASCRKLRGR